MSRVIVTGKPDCHFCDALAKVVQQLGVEFTKVDLTQDEEMLAKAKKGGNRMPACIFVDEARYIVSEATPAKSAPVKAWLEEQGVEV